MRRIGSSSASLKRILLPVAETPDPAAAAEVATRMAEALGKSPMELHAVHVGERMPDVYLPESEHWTWHRSTRQGDVIEEIVGATGTFPPT
jgi:hypothetical protein